MFGHEVFCSNGNRFAWQIDPKTLEALRKLDTRKYFNMRTMNCPPFKEDDGTFVCVCSNITIKGSTSYGIFKVPSPQSPGDFSAISDALASNKTVSVIPTTKTNVLPYLRLFATTKNYYILVEQPYGVNVRQFLSQIFSGSHFCYQKNMEYDETFKNRFLIVEKSTGKLLPQYIESSELFHYFHIGNSYETEDGNYIVIDINSYPNADILVHGFNLENRRNGPTAMHSSIKRFKIPISNNNKEGRITVTPEILNPNGCMFPTLNKERRGKHYRYLYGTTELTINEYSNSLVKIDVETKQVKLWTGEDYIVPYGPLYIPKPGSEQEDDGVIVALISDGRTGGLSSMLFLCAQTMTEISRVQFPHFLPLTTSLFFIPPK